MLGINKPGLCILSSGMQSFTACLKSFVFPLKFMFLRMMCTCNRNFILKRGKKHWENEDGREVKFGLCMQYLVVVDSVAAVETATFVICLALPLLLFLCYSTFYIPSQISVFNITIIHMQNKVAYIVVWMKDTWHGKGEVH